MKKLLSILLVVFLATCVFSQGGSSLADPDPTIIGADSARQALKEVSVDMFEREGSWKAKISPDYGIISARLFEGAPAAKEPIEDTENQQITDEKVLGVKVEFFRRGVNSFFVTSARPLAIEGVTKTVSFWAVGRNQPHKITLLLQDYFGANYELYVGTLDFTGWKKLTVAVPPSPDGVHGIVQTSPYHGDKPGVKILGFRIDCDPMLAKGTYYVYFDDMRAVTDLYAMQNRDEDDMDDNW